MTQAVAAGTPPPAESPAAPAEAEAAGAESSGEAQEAPPENINQLLAKRQPPKPKGKAKAKAEKAGPDDEGEPAEEGDEPAEEAKTEPAKPEEVTAEQLFSDDALSTPEGARRAREIVLAAKTELENRHRRFDRADIKLKRRERELASKESGLTERENEARRVRGLGVSFMQKMAVIKGERTANPVAIMAHLDELAGGPGDPEAGRRLYEEISIAIARDGKAPEPTRAERELRARLEKMELSSAEERRRALADREAFEIQQTRASVEQLERNIGMTANNPQVYPGISGLIARGATTPESVGKWIGDLMQEAAEEGAPLDTATALSILEERVGPSARAPQGAQGSEQPNRSRNGAHRAPTTVLPTQADLSSGRGRPLTHEERLDNLARDPSFFEELGPAFRQHAGL